MPLPRRCLALILGVAVLASFAPARVQAPAPVPQAPPSREEIQRTYAKATPFVDYPLSQLQQEQPVLHGLKAVSSQEQLASLLDKTSEAIATLLPTIPNLISQEKVYRTQFPIALVEKYFYLQHIMSMQLHQSPTGTYSYMILSHRTPAGIKIDEYRANRNQQPIASQQNESNLPGGYGFATLWLLFTSANRVESRFRLLGSQKNEGHQTWVIAFAQDPDQVAYPGILVAGGKTYPLLQQGIVWIDQSTFRIVRIRTDLLAPLPEINMRKLNTELFFREAKIESLPAPVWLPAEVFVTSFQNDSVSIERHAYSKYQLYHVDSRIVSEP